MKSFSYTFSISKEELEKAKVASMANDLARAWKCVGPFALDMRKLFRKQNEDLISAFKKDLNRQIYK